MMTRLAILVLAALLAPGVSGATRYPIAVKDCRGKTIEIVREPKRIISLTPSNTEILFALGLASRVAGVTRWCDYPAAAKKKPKVGDRTTSVEKVVSLRPDLVVAHGTLNDEAIRSIEKHGIAVVAVDPKTIDEVASDIRLIGRIANRSKEAERIASRITSAESSVEKKVAGIRSRPKVLVAVQGDPLWAAGPKTFIDEMIKLAGGVNLAADAKPGFNQFSAEAAVWRNPDVIICTTRGDRAVFSKGIWKRTAAARRGRVYEADPDILVRPGPRLADGIKTVARLVHPDVFKE